jgi:hypothetical protein
MGGRKGCKNGTSKGKHKEEKGELEAKSRDSTQGKKRGRQ